MQGLSRIIFRKIGNPGKCKFGRLKSQKVNWSTVTFVFFDNTTIFPTYSVILLFRLNF